MTAVLLDREPTTAEREQSPLVRELAYVRALLEAFRDGESAADVPPPEPVGDTFEPAVDRVTRLFGLTPFERHLLLLAAAVELDGDIAALAASVQHAEDPHPTFGLALTALPDGHWDALAPRSPLRRWRLIETGAGPTLASRPVRLDERILHCLTGVQAWDARLDGVLRTAVRVRIAPSQERIAVELAHTVAAAGPRVLARIDGDDADARLGVAQALAAAFGRTALVLRAGA
jgi:hypothetical protein